MSETARQALSLLEEAARRRESLPPVQDWNPDYTGELDMRIARDGTWYHEGKPIRRHALARLFSTILRREADGHYLVTPVEKYRIQVDDAPFVATELECVRHEGQQQLVFTTSMGDVVVAGPEHPLEVSTAEGGEPSPYVEVRDGLWALIHRNVFYRLVELAEPVTHEGREWLAVYSNGESFLLGPADEQ